MLKKINFILMIFTLSISIVGCRSAYDRAVDKAIDNTSRLMDKSMDTVLDNYEKTLDELNNGWKDEYNKTMNEFEREYQKALDDFSY